MIPIQLLTLGHTVRVCYDLTNYAELSINSNGDLTIHKLVGGSPKIIDKTATDETFTIPPTDRPLKVGDVLVAIDPCEMNDGSGNALIVGDEYPILKHDTDTQEIAVETKIFNYHFYSLNSKSSAYWGLFFTLKP